MEHFFYVFRYIKHSLLSNSRHGTHSPFVYRLAEELIYGRTVKSIADDNRTNPLVQDIAGYLETGYVFSPQDIDAVKAVCMRAIDASVDEYAELQHRCRYLVLTDIYRSKLDRVIWQQIIEDQRFIVTIDLFFFGLIFYRTEQPKQHFSLRFPLWKYGLKGWR